MERLELLFTNEYTDEKTEIVLTVPIQESAAFSDWCALCEDVIRSVADTMNTDYWSAEGGRLLVVVGGLKKNF